jgi:hypothetical protein
MGTMVATCPKTGIEVSTGIETDLDSFALLPDVPITIACSACGRKHSLSAQDTRLRGAV